MIYLEDLSELSVKTLLRTWLTFLEQEDFGQAAEMLYITGGPSSFAWTTETLKAAVRNHGSLEKIVPGPDFKVTSLESASGRISRFDVHLGTKIESEPTIVGDVWLDLPLNGEISDVVATFFLHKLPAGYAVELSDIR